MPLPKKKSETWQEQSKKTILQNLPLEAYMPTERLREVQSPEHHHHQETIPRKTLFPLKKATNVSLGDRTAGSVLLRPHVHIAVN